MAADHDLALLIQSIQNGVQLLWAARRHALALEIVACYPFVKVPDLHHASPTSQASLSGNMQGAQGSPVCTLQSPSFCYNEVK